MFLRWQRRGNSLVAQVGETVDGGRQRHVAYLGSVQPRSLKSRQNFWGQLALRFRRGELRKVPKAERERLLEQVAEKVPRPKNPTPAQSASRPEEGAPLEHWARWWANRLDHVPPQLAQAKEALLNPDAREYLLEWPHLLLELVDVLRELGDALPPRALLDELAARLEGCGPPLRRLRSKLRT